MSGGIFQSESNTSIPLNELLEDILLSCEREFNNNLSGQTKNYPKRNLMHTLFRTRIVLARYLTALRWCNKTNSSVANESLKNAFQDNNLKVLDTFQSIKKYKRQNQILPLKVLPSFNGNLFSITNTGVSIYETLTRMLQGRLPSSITNVSYNNTYIFISATSYSYCFKVKKSGNISLVKFSMDSVYSRTMITELSKVLSNEFKKLDKFDDFFFKVDKIFNHFHNINYFLRLVEKIKRKEHKYGFEVRNTGEKAVLIFGKNEKYSFDVSVSINCVTIHSSRSIAGKLFSRVITLSNYKDVLAEAQKLVVSTKLHKMHEILVEALRLGGISSFSCEIVNYKIVVDVYNMYFASMYISDFDSTTKVDLCENVWFKKDEFVNFFETYDKHERIAFVHDLFLTKLSHELVLHATPNTNESLNKLFLSHMIVPRYLHYSFSPDFIICIQNTVKTYVSIIDSEGNSYQTKEMIEFNDNSFTKLKEAVLAAKKNMALMQLMKYFNNKGIECKLMKNTIYLEYSVFIDAHFKIINNNQWTLIITRHQKSTDFTPLVISITGHSFTSNFCQYILYIINSVNRQINLFNGVLYAHETNNFVIAMNNYNALSFSFKIFTNDIQTHYVKLNNIKYLGSEGKIQYFEMPSNCAVPSVCLEQCLSTPFNELSKAVARLEKPDINYHRLIISMSKHMSIIYNLFAYTMNWIILEPNEFAIILLCMKIYTLKITSIPTRIPGMHILSIPASKSHELLRVPLSICGKGITVENSSIKYTVSTDDFQNIKRSVEEFFGGYDILKKCGSGKYKITELDGNYVMIFEPLKLGGLEANVKLSAMSFDVTYSGTHLKKINAIKELAESPMYNKNIFCLVFGSLVIGPQLNVAILDGIPLLYKKVPGIDWNKTFSRISISNTHLIQMGLFYGNRRIFIEYGLSNHNMYIKTIEHRSVVKVFSGFNDFVDYLLS